jgi:multiple sugar transport system substrate-binding protein
MASATTFRRTATAGLLVGALAALSLTAACGSDEPSGGPVTLTMSAWGGDADKKAYEERLQLAHQKFPDITVNLQMTPPADYSQKVSTAIAGGTGPDIIELAEQTPVFGSKHQIRELDDQVASSKLDLNATFGDRVPKIFQYDGKQYAIPDRSGAMVLYYNKKMFDAAGVAYPTVDWSQADLLAAAQKLTIHQGAQTTQWGFGTISWYPYWMTFLAQNGGRVLDDKGKPVINSPENVEAMQWYTDLAAKHKVSPTLRDWANYGKGVGPDQLFAQGKLAMEITGFWNLAAATSVPGLDWDVAPVWHGKQRATSAFFNGLAISRTSKHSDEAWKIIQFMASEEGQRPIIENAEDAPANLKVQQSDAFLHPKWATRAVNMNAFAQSADAVFVPPLTPQWNEMLKVCTDNIELMMNQKVTPKEALDTIQKQLEKVMS